MIKNAFIIIWVVLMISCHHQSLENKSDMGDIYIPEDGFALDDEIETEPPRTAAPPPPPPIIEEVPDEETEERGLKIIKNGCMHFKVKTLNDAKNKIDSLIAQRKGYYEEESYASNDQSRSYNLIIRLPTSKFESLIDQLEHGVGDLQSKNISAEDVTEEYVDLEIKLQNSLAYLNQYQEVLKKAKSVKEILEVKEQIRQIEEEINIKKGRMKYLNDRVKYSTLRVIISEQNKIIGQHQPSFGAKIINAFKGGVDGLGTLILGLIYLWPYVFIGILLVVFRQRIWNVFKK